MPVKLLYTNSDNKVNKTFAARRKQGLYVWGGSTDREATTEGVWFRAFKGAQLACLGSIHSKLSQTANSRKSTETGGRIVKRQSCGKGRKIKQERKKTETNTVSQGGTKPVFMIPQIVNPGSNFLLLVHSTNEV